MLRLRAPGPELPRRRCRGKYKLWKIGKNWTAAVGRLPTFETETEKLLCVYFVYANKYGHLMTIRQLIGEARRLAVACVANPAHAGVGSKSWLRGS